MTPTPPDAPDLDALAKLEDAATPGPWTRDWNTADEPNSGIDIEAMGVRVALIEDPDDASEVANADLIVALRNAAPFLIRAARQRDELLRAAEALLNEAEEEFDIDLNRVAVVPIEAMLTLRRTLAAIAKTKEPQP